MRYALLALRTRRLLTGRSPHPASRKRETGQGFRKVSHSDSSLICTKHPGTPEQMPLSLAARFVTTGAAAILFQRNENAGGGNILPRASVRLLEVSLAGARFYEWQFSQH
jgi:hypothetical protein